MSLKDVYIGKAKSGWIKGHTICFLSPALPIAFLALFFMPFRDYASAGEAWRPGQPHPDWPHVVAADKPDTWRPEDGWTFANDLPNDFSVKPATDQLEPGKPAVISGPRGRLVIPPPDGFLSARSGTTMDQVLQAMSAADTENTSLATWLSPVFPWRLAYVRESNAFKGKTLTLTEFGKLQNALPNFIANPSEEYSSALTNAASRMSAAVDDIRNKIGLDSSNMELTGYTMLPPHLKEPDKTAWTMVFTVTNGLDAALSISAESCCILWLQGKVLFLYYNHEAAANEARDDAVQSSREVLSTWVDAVVATNSASPSFPGADLAMHDRAIREERKSRSASRSDGSSFVGRFVGRIVAFAIIGGIVGLLKAVFWKDRN